MEAPIKKLVKGEGIYEKGKFTSKINGSITKEYDLWKSMLTRCYDPKFHIRRPTYIGCTVSENFKNFQYFAEWCNNQIGFGNRGWQLDKDILLIGNKGYNENICVFVPSQLNSLLINKSNYRGEEPVGVQLKSARNKYVARISIGGERKWLGTFDNEDDAFNSYKICKEYNIKEMAHKYEGLIDPRVYNCLMAWEIDRDV